MSKKNSKAAEAKTENGIRVRVKGDRVIVHDTRTKKAIKAERDAARKTLTGTFGFAGNPTTRVFRNKKAYDRSRAKAEARLMA